MSATAGILDWSRQVGVGSVTLTADATLTQEDLIKKVLQLTGAPTATTIATFPLADADRGYSVTLHNQTGQSIRCKIGAYTNLAGTSVSASGGVLIPAYEKREIYFNGTDFEQIGTFRSPSRYELRWVAGERGLPQLSAVTQLPAGNTYNTADFLANQNADHNFEILGSNGSSDDITISVEGGLKMETDGGGTDSVILLPHLTTIQSPWKVVTWGTDQETEWECTLRTGSSVAGHILWAGLKLTNTATIDTDAKQCFFRYEVSVNSGKWAAIYSINNADTTTVSEVTLAADTVYKLAIKIDSARIARFYINDALVVASTALDNTTDFIPYIGILETAAAARHLYVYGQSISRKIA
jgi:hypothetical protein